MGCVVSVWVSGGVCVSQSARLPSPSGHCLRTPGGRGGGGALPLPADPRGEGGGGAFWAPGQPEKLFSETKRNVLEGLRLSRPISSTPPFFFWPLTPPPPPTAPRGAGGPAHSAIACIPQRARACSPAPGRHPLFSSHTTHTPSSAGSTYRIL